VRVSLFLHLLKKRKRENGIQFKPKKREKKYLATSAETIAFTGDDDQQTQQQSEKKGG